MLSLTVICKLAGALLLFFSVCTISYLSYQRQREQLARIDALVSFVKYIREQIDRYLTPLGEILGRCDRGILDGIFIGCGGECGRIKDKDELRRKLLESEYFSDGGEALERFLAKLGSSYHDEEVAACDECLAALCELSLRLKEQLPKRHKSRTVLLFCFAAAALILLL